MIAGLDDIAHDTLVGAGYAGLVAIMIVENLFPPIPSEIVLPLAGYEVSRGELSYVATVAAATLGSVVWNAVLIGAGWALGDNWDAISGWVGGASKVVLVAAVAGIAGLFLARRVRRGRRSASP
ncbi:DedA family protein [Capillimicrobium parvum]|uniref:DedA family protein n=1 Tax=Capillimicrobium parvum TaxID=2884022 RepID=A0A9E7C2X4_9ACTN|nr:hypothetical protein [Capillimicrobium parvum]UGS38955.1 hypothetical protein DSM104329_05387 [Capillimicrobium parvum]